MIRALLAVLLLCLAVATSTADEFRPAFLELRQTGPDSYDVLWKRPALDADQPMALTLLLPDAAQAAAPRRRAFALGAVVERWPIRISGGLEGRRISVRNETAKGVDVLVRYLRADGTAQVARLTRMAPDFVPTAAPGSHEVARTYLWLGIQHILQGLDHLMFVAAMVLLVKNGRQLLWTITAFTLAHSVTLGLASLGVLDVPGPPVEAMIALSILLIAVEVRHNDSAGTARTAPWLVAFAFGLLHGLGFAGALAEIGLPEASIPLALLFFNIGVEIGQLCFVAALLAGAAVFSRAVRSARGIGFARLACINAIGVIAAYWVVERVMAIVT